jgi:predicted aminopeptidase
LYVKNDVTFNENLANFIGAKGAEQFLLYKYGKDSKQYIHYKQSEIDTKIYTDYILSSTQRLKALYSTFSKSETEVAKTEKKKKLIAKIVSGVNKLPLYSKRKFFRYTLQAFREGNAFFMSFERYDSEFEKFEKEYKKYYNSDLKTYLKAMKEKYPSL